MGKLIKTFLITLCSITLIFGTSLTAFAEVTQQDYPNDGFYVLNDYEWYDGLSIRVDNFHGNPNPVVAYIYVESDDRIYANEGFVLFAETGGWSKHCEKEVFGRWFYTDREPEPYELKQMTHDEYGDTIITYVEGIGYSVFTENKTVVTTLPHGEIWSYQFGLQDGDYDFTHCDHDVIYNMNDRYSVLFTNEPSYSPIYREPDADATEEEIEAYYTNRKILNDHYTVIRCEDGKVNNLYIMRGSLDWQQEVFQEFYEWAMENEKNMSKLIYSKTEEETPEKTTAIEEPTPKPVEETVIDNTSASAVKSTPIPENTESEELEEESSSTGWIIVIAGITLFVIIIIIGYRKKHNK